MWKRYRGLGEPDARDQLLLHYQPLLKFVADRVGLLLDDDADCDTARDRVAAESIDPMSVVVDCYEEIDSRHALVGALSALNDREHVVVVSYYFDHMTLAEVGTRLGVTESRVSQIHRKAVGRLRAKLVRVEPPVTHV